jgi:DNA-binding FadR family transcriptional regulator
MRILEGIRAQNPDGAKQAMAQHLASVQDELESTIGE